jgi:hypothetical protein
MAVPRFTVKDRQFHLLVLGDRLMMRADGALQELPTYVVLLRLI